MKITYDKEVDAIYIQLLEGKHQCHSVRLSDEVALNIGKKEKLVGIEILDASRVLGKNGKMTEIMIENLSFAEVTKKLNLIKGKYTYEPDMSHSQVKEPKSKYNTKG
jgi:uncharacterized protein YuzE